MTEKNETGGTRRFTKKVTVINMMAAWGLIFFAVWFGVVDAVIGPVVGLLGFLFATYAGVGHLDYRTYVDAGKEGDRE